MDPLTLSSAFATIVGLIINFRQERGAQAELSHREFVDWLERHQHNELKELIVHRAEIQIAVDQVLRAEHQQMMAQLTDISALLASLVSRIDGLNALSEAAGITGFFSDQAIQILRALVNSTSSEFSLIGFRGDGMLHLLGGGTIPVTEQRFLSDDLDTLVARGLLKLRIGSSGGKFYGITRNAVKLVGHLDQRAAK